MLTGVKLPDRRGNVNAEDGCNGEAFTGNCDAWIENKSEIPSAGTPSTFRFFDMVRQAHQPTSGHRELKAPPTRGLSICPLRN